MNSTKILSILFILIFLSGCEEKTIINNQPEEVLMGDTAFIPAELILTRPGIVRWINTSNVAHTVTSADGLFDQHLEVEESFEHFFANPGTYLYYCQYHQGMTATIVVQGVYYRKTKN
jgi:plastocyanin